MKIYTYIIDGTPYAMKVARTVWTYTKSVRIVRDGGVIATLESIAITTPATKTEYTVGDVLDITGLVVTGTYSDGSTKRETVTVGNITGFNSTVPAANQVLTITIGGKTTSYNVNIVAPPPPATLESIAVTTLPTKVEYTVGEDLDITGLVVTGTYSDGSTRQETVTIGDITGFDNSVVAVDQVLTITIGGKTATFTVNIVAPSLPVYTLGEIQNNAVKTVGLPGIYLIDIDRANIMAKYPGATEGMVLIIEIDGTEYEIAYYPDKGTWRTIQEVQGQPIDPAAATIKLNALEVRVKD